MIRKAGKFTCLLVIEAVSALLIGLVVLAALFFWRLSTGPVKVDFLTPWIEQTLNNAETGVRVEIGDTVLNWGGSAQELEPGSFNFRAFDIRARDVRIRGRTGALIAAVPALGISFDMRGSAARPYPADRADAGAAGTAAPAHGRRHRRRYQDGGTGGRAGRYRPDGGGAEGASTAARQPARPAVAADRSAGRRRAADAGRSGDASGLAGSPRRRDASPGRGRPARLRKAGSGGRQADHAAEHRPDLPQRRRHHPDADPVRQHRSG